LGNRFSELIENDSDFELAIEPMANIVCFRFVNPKIEAIVLNEINLQIRQEILEDGEFYVVQTKLRGKHYLRTAIMNPFTTEEDLKCLLEKIRTFAQKR